MDASKEALLQRLLKDGKITQDEFYLLSRKEIEYPSQPPVFPTIGKKLVPIIPQPFPNPQMDWMQKEMENRQRIAENCGCNPANGGSGICGCVLTSPIIT
jgi:hypothetical protein